jgi:hypothetical protein
MVHLSGFYLKDATFTDLGTFRWVLGACNLQISSCFHATSHGFAEDVGILVNQRAYRASHVRIVYRSRETHASNSPCYVDASLCSLIVFSLSAPFVFVVPLSHAAGATAATTTRAMVVPGS